MERRDFLKIIGASVLGGKQALANLGQPGQAKEINLQSQNVSCLASQKPDVLVILTNKLNPYCLGYVGHPDVLTPNIDRLADQGTSFKNVYTSSPGGMASRFPLISGLYPHNHGLWYNNSNFHIPVEMAPMFRDIQKAGYYTAQIGKLHWFSGASLRSDYKNPNEYFNALGLDYCERISTPMETPLNNTSYERHLKKIGLLDAYCWDIAERFEKSVFMVRPSPVPSGDHNDSFIALKSIDLIRNQPVDKPLCLVTSFVGPGDTLNAPGEYARKFDPEKIEIPPDIPDQFVWTGDKQNYTRDEIKKIRANYYGKIALIDYWIGKIIEAQKNRGKWDNTLVILTSNTGYLIGRHNHFGINKMWEESARVPLIMRWPDKIKPGRKTDAFVQSFDIYPSIVEAIGGKVSDGHFAKSLLPIATAQAGEIRDAVFSEIGKNSLRHMIRMGRYKWFITVKQQHLYDLVEDPREINNLIDSASHREILQQMRARHLKFFLETQYNLSRNYQPLTKRIKSTLQTDTKGLAEQLYYKFKKFHGL